jgi:hypothetical protein
MTPEAGQFQYLVGPVDGQPELRCSPEFNMIIIRNGLR